MFCIYSVVKALEFPYPWMYENRLQGIADDSKITHQNFAYIFLCIQVQIKCDTLQLKRSI